MKFPANLCVLKFCSHFHKALKSSSGIISAAAIFLAFSIANEEATVQFAHRIASIQVKIWSSICVKSPLDWKNIESLASAFINEECCSISTFYSKFPNSLFINIIYTHDQESAWKEDLVYSTSWWFHSCSLRRLEKLLSLLLDIFAILWDSFERRLLLNTWHVFIAFITQHAFVTHLLLIMHTHT